MRWSVVLALTAVMTLPVGARAEPPPHAQAEINYLLGFVRASGCEFYRNGTWYDSERAQEHLRYKYEYLSAHDRVATAEEFIEQAATKSSLTGRPYLLRCGRSKVVTSEEWLRAALARLRSSAADY